MTVIVYLLYFWILYIGKANRKDGKGLYHRLKEYMISNDKQNFGNHKGGRAIWQLSEDVISDINIAVMSIDNREGIVEEERLFLESFECLFAIEDRNSHKKIYPVANRVL